MLRKIIVKSAFRVTFLIFGSFFLLGEKAFAQGNNNTIELTYDFRASTLGWTAGFSDYSTATNPGVFEFETGLRFMPRKLTRLPRRGFFIQGHNRSDDLFMFLKRRLTSADGIIAGQSYRIHFVVTLASNAASNCGGIGGAPGESVALKVGASAIEPLSVLQSNGAYRMNVDKGNQSIGGTAASVAGNIANGIPCEQALPIFPFALIQRSHQHTSNVTANANGELWLLIGTDSGFEGLTRLYYQNIQVKLTPI